MDVAPETHVAVFTFPFSSHPAVLLKLVRTLAVAAPKVVFSFFNTAKSNRALFKGLPTHNIRPIDVSDGLPEDYVSAGNPLEEISMFLAAAKVEFTRCVKAAEADVGLRISCLVMDAFISFSGGEIAEEMNIPWVITWNGGPCGLFSHFHTDHIRQKIGRNGMTKSAAGPEDEIMDLIPGLPPVRLADLPGGVVFGDLESPISTTLHKLGTTLPKANAVAINSFQELFPGITKDLTSNFKNFLNIGPFNLMSKQNPPAKSDEYSCISWLDGQKPRSVVYISFGTVVRLPPQELVAMAEALDETKTPFLWSIKDDSQKHLPREFLERVCTNGMGKVVPWAPQVQVLEHTAIAAYATHSGWNSVWETIEAGVPMICRPFFADQFMNTWLVEKVWGIGVRIEGGVFTKDGTCGALEQVLSLDKSSARMKERGAALKELAHKAVGPNGSSNQNFKTLVDVITGATL